LGFGKKNVDENRRLEINVTTLANWWYAAEKGFPTQARMHHCCEDPHFQNKAYKKTIDLLRCKTYKIIADGHF